MITSLQLGLALVISPGNIASSVTCPILASDMTSTGQCDFVLEIPWNSRAVRFGGCIHERLKGISLRLGSLHVRGVCELVRLATLKVVGEW